MTCHGYPLHAPTPPGALPLEGHNVLVFALLAFSAVAVYFDARSLRYDPKKVGGFAGIGPGGWAFCSLVMWLFVVPLYIAQRGRLAASGRGDPDPLTTGSKVLRFLSGFFGGVLILLIIVAIEAPGPAKSGATGSLASQPAAQAMAAPVPPSVEKSVAPVVPDGPSPGAAAGAVAPPALLGKSLKDFRRYTSACKGAPIRDAIKGEPRFFCQLRKPGIFEAMGEAANLRQLTLMAGISGNSPADLLDAMNAVFDFIHAVTGRKVGDIAPDHWVEKLGLEEQTFDWQGYRVETKPFHELRLISVVIQAAPRPEGPTGAAAHDETVRLSLVSNDDSTGPVKAQRVRHYVFDGYLTKAALRQVLEELHRQAQAELQQLRQPNRFATVFVYRNERRARAGRGEWNGMASSRSLDGATLGGADFSMRVPVDPPSEAEDGVYDDLMDELARRDSAGDYQNKVVASGRTLTSSDIATMGRLTDADERAARKAIAAKHRMTVKQLDEIVAMVTTYEE